MKAYQLTMLALAAVGTLAFGAPKKAPLDLGNVLYIGDSITHGFGTPSYRWALHKIFVDNGIKYEEIGVATGNDKNGIPANTIYIDTPFKNTHAAQSSERAREVSNRKPFPSRLDGTSVFHWLDLKKDATGEKIEPVSTRRLVADPDTCFILLGTNDTLSEYGGRGGIAKNIDVAEKELLDRKKGDLPVIVSALRQKNPKMRIVLLTIPTWYNTQSNTGEKDYASIVVKYYKKFANAFKKDTVVNINEGLVDICCTEKPYRAVKGFFHDNLHPSLQGDLIMAGLVARTMGYAGRTAGAARKAASAFALPASALLESASEKEGAAAAGQGLTLAPSGKMVCSWPEGSEAANGFTVELQMNVGNGPAGGWDTKESAVLSLGNGAHSGKLKLSEGYIMWNNDTVIYPVNMADKKLEPIRVMWVPGNEMLNVNKGFYVWLGDMLIGEGLPDDGEKFNGIGLANTSTQNETVKFFAAEDKPSAPATTRTTGEATLVQYEQETAAK